MRIFDNIKSFKNVTVFFFLLNFLVKNISLKHVLGFVLKNKNLRYFFMVLKNLLGDSLRRYNSVIEFLKFRR
jgi:hypothetical protein